MKLTEQTITHIIIGSGAAGFQAALRLYQNGERDLAIITENIKSGTSRNTGSDKQTYYKLTLSGNDADSVRNMAEDLFAGQCVDGDQALCEAALSARCFFALTELGVPFPCTEHGEFMGYKTDHDRGRRATSAGPYTSKLMTEALERSVKEKQILILDQMQAIQILTYMNQVKGILCLDKNIHSEPAYKIIWCKNVILATGGPAGMYHDSVYPVSQTGSTGMAQAAGGEIVKEVKAVIKIHALQQVIGNQHAGKVDVAFIVNKVLIDFSDVFVAFQQDLVFTPFVIYLGAFGGGNDTLYNIGVTLRMYSLLISLNRQNQVDFRSGDVFADVRQIVGLDTVQKNQKRQNAVISSLFRGGQLLIGALVIKQRNFFRNPEVFHHQAVDFVRPLVFDVVQIKQVGNVAANHTAVDDFVISVNVKKFFSLHFSLLSGAADAFRLFQTGTVLLNGAGVIKGFDVLFPGAHYRIVNVFGANVAV